ncbi:DUF3488 domain-containing protein [Verminephrobacter eiseniae]|uniref:transglutaminase family protein n=1 Tax=Verminephrobacter eiseniae TaxID=364317 RepID=UPI0022372B17|nr:DUF3488 and transglutaminase-like domain-containing protein [Verminephrobacter eiseniae]MCW5263489.1 DUF3488 domain-containing protein [Verminephrobacter eiseniae]
MTPYQRLDALPRDARDTLFLLCVIAWVIAPQVGVLPVWVSLLAGGLLLWRGVLAWAGRPLPGRWTLAVALLGSMAGTWLTHGTLLGRDAGVTLIVLLLVLKTLELRARRDAMVVFFLGFFALLSNFLFSQSLLTAAAMLLALLGLLTALVNAHMPVGRPPLAQVLRIAAGMAALGAPIMAALFMLFPRVAPLWGLPGDSMSGRSGLSDSMQLGQITKLVLDESVALRVRFDGPDGVVPPQSDLYFRGPVFGFFDGSQWQPLLRHFGDERLAQTDRAVHLRVQGTPLRYEVTLAPHQRPWLLLLDAALEPPVVAGMQAFMTPDLQWRTSRPITNVLRYQARSYTRFSYGLDAVAADLRVYTALPPGLNPRTLALARQMRSQPQMGPDHPGSAEALVRATLARLRSGGYTYTLEPGPYGPDSADEFWFDHKQGFCEHIASAFVLLMRALDIPARIVTGYQGGERNPIDGLWTVRQSDAHAWAEVWIARRGWVRVDPTGAVAPSRTGAFQRLRVPPGALAAAMEQVISPDLTQSLRALWEAANNRWNQWVLNYTQSRQLDLLKSLGFATPDWPDLIVLLGLLVLLAALAGIAWSLWERNRHDPWLRLLARARQRLARAGLALPETLPPRALAERALARFGAPAAALADWLLRLEQLRYAARPDTGLARLRREFGALPWSALARR